jgi:nicotinate-nucleotide adenylyltransferase
MRIGVFGGTFDPPHIGHLIVAGDVHARLGLDRVLFVPSAVPPHKIARVRASADLRARMVRAATGGDPRFEVDELELRREGPSYTVDTLRELRDRFRGAELFFLIGMDALRDFPTWRAPDEILRMAQLAVVGSGTVLVPVTRIDLSATEIRRRIAAGESIRHLVSEPVREIIAREGLYR